MKKSHPSVQEDRNLMSPHQTDLPTRGLALYQSSLCWFCAKVRNTITQLGISLEIRDIGESAAHRSALQAGGGKTQVPCLRVEDDSGHVTWMYESADICTYLERRFGKA